MEGALNVFSPFPLFQVEDSAVEVAEKFDWNSDPGRSAAGDRRVAEPPCPVVVRRLFAVTGDFVKGVGVESGEFQRRNRVGEPASKPPSRNTTASERSGATDS